MLCHDWVKTCVQTSTSAAKLGVTGGWSFSVSLAYLIGLLWESSGSRGSHVYLSGILGKKSKIKIRLIFSVLWKIFLPPWSSAVVPVSWWPLLKHSSSRLFDFRLQPTLFSFPCNWKIPSNSMTITEGRIWTWTEADLICEIGLCLCKHAQSNNVKIFQITVLSASITALPILSAPSPGTRTGAS